ncbi:MAG: proton-conducting transporter membrane subunit, partial [Calditrichia bacterium]
SKGGVFAVLLRLFTLIGTGRYPAVFIIFSIIAIASMILGNLLALLQNNVKRILAYSSIAHLGYVLVAFLAAGNLAVEAATFYLVAYFITISGAFGIVTLLSSQEGEAEQLDSYRGLFWTRPLIAAIFSAMMLSLAGIPLTAGFIGKFYLVSSGVNSSLWTLVIVLVLTSAVGLFYYLRVIVTMYAQPESAKKESTAHPAVSLAGGIAIGALTLLLIWFGILPSGILQVIREMVASLDMAKFSMLF